jgi:hypothetical protein
MSKKMNAMTSENLARAVDSYLDPVTVSHRHVSFGIDCSATSRIERSIFDGSQKRIVMSLQGHTEVDMSRPDLELLQTSLQDYQL